MILKRYSLRIRPTDSHLVYDRLVFFSDEFKSKSGRGLIGQIYSTIENNDMNNKELEKELDKKMRLILSNRTGIPGYRGYFKLVNAISLFERAKIIKDKCIFYRGVPITM